MRSNRLNSTGRISLDPELFEVNFDSGVDGTVLVSLTVKDLSSLSLPSDARLICEVHRRDMLSRFDCGTVAMPRALTSASAAPLLLADSPQVRLRALSAATGSKGLVLAEGQPRTGAGSADRPTRALLRQRFEDLGERVWGVTVDETEGPVLTMNRKLPDADDLMRTPIFQSLVLPQVMREIALWLLAVQIDELDSEESPASLWLRYIESRDPELSERYQRLREQSESQDADAPFDLWREHAEWADAASDLIAEEQASFTQLMRDTARDLEEWA